MNGRLLTVLLLLYSSSTAFSGDYNTILAGHKQLLIEEIADKYLPPGMHIVDPEKYYWPKAIARFERYGKNDSLANSWVEKLAARSPFHFTLLGMARMISLYPDAPAIKTNEILILRKVFDVKSSYNPWTAEGTENHINMSRTSGYIFALKALAYPDEFPEAPLRLKEMEDWILYWSRKIYVAGTGEWNSSIYEVYNLAGWLNIYDFSPNPKIRAAAKAVLDYYVAELSLYYSFGTPGGAEMRGTGAANRNIDATNYLNWYWFSEELTPMTGFAGSHYIQVIHAATSNYIPNPIAVNLARKTYLSPSFYRNSNPSYLLDTPSFVDHFFYADSIFTLGSCNSPYGGWTGTTYQMVNWKLAVKTKDGSPPFEISGNGRFYDEWSGKTTNPFTQIVQHRNVLVQMTRTPVNSKNMISEIQGIINQWQIDWWHDFKLRYPGEEKPQVVNMGNKIIALNKSFISLPESIGWKTTGNACYLDMKKAYAVVRFLGDGENMTPQKPQKTEPDRQFLLDQAKPGKLCGFVIEICDAASYSGFSDFIAEADSRSSLDRKCIQDGQISYFSISGDTIVARYNASGAFTEATSDWGYGCVKPAISITEPPFHQPEWPKGYGYGRVPECYVNGVKQDVESIIPVFMGPNLVLENSILTFIDGNHRIVTDYSGVFPDFREYFEND